MTRYWLSDPIYIHPMICRKCEMTLTNSEVVSILIDFFGIILSFFWGLAAFGYQSFSGDCVRKSHAISPQVVQSMLPTFYLSVDIIWELTELFKRLGNVSIWLSGNSGYGNGSEIEFWSLVSGGLGMRIILFDGI